MRQFLNIIFFPALVFFCSFSAASAQSTLRDRAFKNIHYLVRDSILMQQIRLDESGISIFASAKDKSDNRPEFSKTWKELERMGTSGLFHSPEGLKKYKAGDVPTSIPEKRLQKSLKGARIVLDPGHFANKFDVAVYERKFMKIKAKDVGTKKDIEFYESDIAHETARILKKRLEKQGAIVLITRKKGKSVLGMTYKKWMRKKFKSELEKDVKSGKITQEKMNHYLNKATAKERFKYMNNKDLRKRAEIINGFNPDLTINIHYNASGKRIGKDGYFSPVAVNYCMAFTGGGFMKGELNSKEARFHFLRLLLTEDLTNSIRFSNQIIKSHKRITGVPIITNSNDNPYQFRNSVYGDEPGVYCRNLFLTRAVKGVICFGESLIQDNINEAVILNLNNYKEGRVRTSSRVKLVVDAYQKGILEYFNHEK